MKSFLQNLLIFFALCLCALMVVQWVRETHLHKRVQEMADDIHSKGESIQNLQGTVKRDENEIQRLDGIKNELTETVKSNKLEISELAKELEKMSKEAEKNLRQSEVYKEALDTANSNVLKQNELITTQNAEMKKLVDQRNDTVKKFNEMATNYNNLVSNWNKLQEDLTKAATNPPAKK